MSEQNPPRRHHYIPEFYSKWWVGDDGMLQRYTRPFKRIECRRVFPSQVGWKIDLYRAPEQSLDAQFSLEMKTFKAIDNRAAIALNKLNDPKLGELDVSASYWTHFILSLFHRTPAQMAAIKAYAQVEWRTEQSDLRQRYADLRSDADPPTYDEFLAQLKNTYIEQSVLRVLTDLILSKNVANFIHNMNWMIIPIPENLPSLLLSDEPVLRSNGIAKPEGHLALPLSPRRLFVAVWHEKMRRWLKNAPIKDLVQAMNVWTVESARHFVVAQDKSQSRFIENRFGLLPKPPLSAPGQAKPPSAA